MTGHLYFRAVPAMYDSDCRCTSCFCVKVNEECSGPDERCCDMWYLNDVVGMPKFSKCCGHCCINLCSRCINSFKDAINATQLFLTSSAMSSLGSHVILSQTAFHILDTYLLIAVKEASVCEAVWLLFAVTHVCVSLSAFWQSKKASTLVQTKLSCLPRVIIASPAFMQLHQVSHSGA